MLIIPETINSPPTITARGLTHFADGRHRRFSYLLCVSAGLSSIGRVLVAAGVFVEALFTTVATVKFTIWECYILRRKDMYYETGDKQDGVIDFKKGIQRLNGSQALQYARFRHDQFADISRTARQQTVLKAIAIELTQPQTLPKLPWLIPQAYKAIKTDLGITKLWSFSGILLHWDHMEVVSQTLPGYFADEKKISYWKVDPSQAPKVASQLFEQGKTNEVFANPPANTTIHKPEQTSSIGKEYANSSDVSERWPVMNSLADKGDQVEQGLPVNTYEFEFTQDERSMNRYGP